MTGAPTWSVPPNTPPAECRSCGKRIFWITTANHKLMPVDCAVPGGREPTPSEKGLHQGMHGLGVSHFATCKQADQWRKKKG
jgi:hypothetical protein